MVQLIYKDKIYLCGKISEVMEQLKSLCSEYKTVKDLLDGKMDKT